MTRDRRVFVGPKTGARPSRSSWRSIRTVRLSRSMPDPRQAKQFGLATAAVDGEMAERRHLRIALGVDGSERTSTPRRPTSNSTSHRARRPRASAFVPPRRDSGWSSARRGGPLRERRAQDGPVELLHRLPALDGLQVRSRWRTARRRSIASARAAPLRRVQSGADHDVLARRQADVRVAQLRREAPLQR